jgi:biotin operon repressor
MKYSIPQIGVKHIDWVGLILGTDLPHIAKTVAMYLSRYMTADKTVAWPSLNRIATELSLSKSTICEYLKLLEEEGWIVRKKGNFEKTTQYTISFPQIIQDQIGSPPAGQGSTPDGQGNTGAELGLSASRTRVVREPDTINNIFSNIYSNKYIYTKFQKPTLEEIKQYCLERHNDVDPNQFYDFYESKGWLVGKVKMKNWQAAVRTWERNSVKTKETSAYADYM